MRSSVRVAMVVEKMRDNNGLRLFGHVMRVA